MRCKTACNSETTNIINCTYTHCIISYFIIVNTSLHHRSQLFILYYINDHIG